MDVAPGVPADLLPAAPAPAPAAPAPAAELTLSAAVCTASATAGDLSRIDWLAFSTVSCTRGSAQRSCAWALSFS
ncbi:hypothetical protein FO013_18015 [Brevibacterium aurantiacum]|uniref:Uncharacterized protein n=1 Tax=Brevibacterium aurantiacum TaxID=273384 RepID=A0A556C7I4_BREAU|nr:hypothetical protein FO013_18015 [Brevibacterium aurantiacum]